MVVDVGVQNHNFSDLFGLLASIFHVSRIDFVRVSKVWHNSSSSLLVCMCIIRKVMTVLMKLFMNILATLYCPMLRAFNILRYMRWHWELPECCFIYGSCLPIDFAPRIELCWQRYCCSIPFRFSTENLWANSKLFNYLTAIMVLELVTWDLTILGRKVNIICK